MGVKIRAVAGIYGPPGSNRPSGTTISRVTNTTAMVRDKAAAQAIAAIRDKITQSRPKIAAGVLRSWEALALFLDAPKSEGMFVQPFNAEMREIYFDWLINTADKREAQKFAAAKGENDIPVDEYKLEIPGITLFPQQIAAFNQIMTAYHAGKRAVMVAMGTGTGKTIVAAAVVEAMRQLGVVDTENFMPVPKAMCNTKKQVVLATRDKFEKLFKFRTTGDTRQTIDPLIGVYHYNTFSTQKWKYYWRHDKAGNLDPEEIEMYGNVLKIPFWRSPEPLKIVILDECHELKKPKASRSKRMLGIIRSKAAENCFFIFMSATPAVTLNDTRMFNLAAKLATPANMTEFLTRFLKGKGDLSTPNAAAIKRWKDFVGIMHVAPPEDKRAYKCTYEIKVIDFATPEIKARYLAAEETFQAAVEASGGIPTDTSMAQFTIFRREAEVCKAPDYARMIMDAVDEGKSPVLACCYVDTIISVVAILAEHGYTRNVAGTHQISLVWGGQKLISAEECFPALEMARISTRIKYETAKYVEEFGEEPKDELYFLTDKDKAKFNRTREFNRQRTRRGETKAQQNTRVEWLRTMELDKQSDQERHEEVQRFLRDESHVCLFTFAAGGTGIDLDNQIVGGRQRVLISTVCYWAEEFLQAFGRCARIMTKSDVHHVILMFRDSIEAQHVAPKLAPKLRSIKALTGIQGDLEDLLEASIIKARKAGVKVVAETVRDNIVVESDDLVVDEDGADEDEDDDKEYVVYSIHTQH